MGLVWIGDSDVVVGEKGKVETLRLEAQAEEVRQLDSELNLGLNLPKSWRIFELTARVTP